jgi:hypothetical protein
MPGAAPILIGRSLEPGGTACAVAAVARPNTPAVANMRMRTLVSPITELRDATNNGSATVFRPVPAGVFFFRDFAKMRWLVE